MARARKNQLFSFVAVIALGLIGWAVVWPEFGSGGAAAPGATPTSRTKLVKPLVLSIHDGGTATSDRLFSKREYVDTDLKLVVSDVEHADHEGKLTLLANRETIVVPFSADPSRNDKKLEVTFADSKKPFDKLVDQGLQTISATWEPAAPEEYQESQVPEEFEIDTKGPVLRETTLTGQAEIGSVLVLRFDDDDLDPETAKKGTTYLIEVADANGGFTARPTTLDNQVVHNGNVVRLFLGRLITGQYRVTVRGASAAKAANTTPAASTTPAESTPPPPTTTILTDLAGNHAGGEGDQGKDQYGFFTSFPERETGRHVEFPEYLPTASQPETERRWNPSDHVETRVVRLYYFRDAHRLAQIINRTAKSYNRAAVDLEQRRAADARNRANELTDERRHKEREAYHIAEDLRRLEHDLVAAQQNYQAVQAWAAQLPAREEQMRRRIAEINEELGTPNLGTAKQEELKAERNDLRKALVTLSAETAKAVNDSFAQMQQIEGHVNQQRQRAYETNEAAQQKTAEEDRAHEEAFRRKVAAEETDPDTYAPALKNSVDPVAQVSISVIGEGVLQLRGPRKGIDKIRDMIHRIDTPLGQVRVDVITVQLNGERGDRLEKPIGLVDANLGLGRFLTAQSLMLLRKAIQWKADEIAANHYNESHYQTDRDRRYLYEFFGRDFIDELYEMDSEFLRTENKVLSLHSMDTTGLHNALFVLALAKNDVRQDILTRFMELAHSELPQAEFHYRASSEMRPHRTQKLFPHWNRNHLPVAEKARIEANTLEACFRNARQRYHFSNLLAFFNYAAADTCNPHTPHGDTMNATQREFIRLAQIYKARMVTEMELKQRVMERALVEDEREESFKEEADMRAELRNDVLLRAGEVREARFTTSSAVTEAIGELQVAVLEARTLVEQSVAVCDRSLLALRPLPGSAAFGSALLKALPSTEGLSPAQLAELATAMESDMRRLHVASETEQERFVQDVRSAVEELTRLASFVDRLRDVSPHSAEGEKHYGKATGALARVKRHSTAIIDGLEEEMPSKTSWKFISFNLALHAARYNYEEYAHITEAFWATIERLTAEFGEVADVRTFDWRKVTQVGQQLTTYLASLLHERFDGLRKAAGEARTQALSYHSADLQHAQAEHFLARTRADFDRNKLLDHLIDEHQEKYMDILEGTRARIATMDDYLKRLSIALEDDFKVQFYDPAFVRIREASRQWDVTLGAVERTSILTNNRTFATVVPQATMEFDLPKRDILFQEILKNAKAVTEDMGALLNDPTFISAVKMMGGGPIPTKVQSLVPGLPNSPDESQMGVNQDGERELGSALEALIQDPAIYKIETGTGYEVRPVIQPDGNSIVYDFFYMYTTNVREPVRADEKHLGRIKRHFIKTQVQTSSFELREVSRYQVALKVARTSQGVQGLQDVPVVGLLFRPLPSDQSSIQENIILAQSTVYPTVFDLMGLRWASSVVDIDHVSVRDAEHVVRGRYKTLTNSIFDATTERVDEMLDIEHRTPQHYRPGLYHPHSEPSPYHPGGYIEKDAEQLEDPSGRGFRIPDRRPVDMQEPPYDPRTRNPIRFEEIVPGEYGATGRAAPTWPSAEDRAIPRQQEIPKPPSSPQKPQGVNTLQSRYRQPQPSTRPPAGGSPPTELRIRTAERESGPQYAR